MAIIGTVDTGIARTVGEVFAAISNTDRPVTRSAIDALRFSHAHPDAAARAFRASPDKAGDKAGDKVVGVLSQHVPQELILAAGLFPVLLASNPFDETPVGDRYMEPFFDGPIRSLFDRLLTGVFDFVDFLIVPRCGEGFLQLYYFLEEARRWEPERRIPEAYLFDLLHTPFWSTGRYVRGRLDALRTRLGELAGRAIDDDAIISAIRRINANAHLLARVNELRHHATPRLSGADALRLFTTLRQLDQDSGNDLLRALLDEVANAPPLPGTRIMVKGSPHDTTRFYDLVETCGAVVVADDHMLGQPMIPAPAADDVDPMEALTQKYHLLTPSIRSYPQAEQDRLFLAMVEQAAVQAVVFYHEAHDDTLGWDYPDQKRKLDALGIPSIFLRQQSYRDPDQAAQREAVRGLLNRVGVPA